MTDLINTGEIPRGALDETTRIYTADHTAVITGAETTGVLAADLGRGDPSRLTGEPLLVDTRPARHWQESLADFDPRPYPQVPPLPPPPAPDDFTGELLGSYEAPAPRPAWARHESGEFPPVRRSVPWDRPTHKQPSAFRRQVYIGRRSRTPRWARWCVRVGATLAVGAALVVGWLAVIR